MGGGERGTCAVRFLGKKEIVTKVDIWEIGGRVVRCCREEEGRKHIGFRVFVSLKSLRLWEEEKSIHKSFWKKRWWREGPPKSPVRSSTLVARRAMLCSGGWKEA